MTKRLVLAAILLLCFSLREISYAAIAAGTVFEVRTTGSDNSGGGYVSGGGGTDYTLQDAAQFSGTDLTVDPVTNTKVQAASHNFVAADVGNLIQITAGVGFTTGFYQILSVAANEATLDRSPGAIGITGGTWAEGGALATPGKAGAAASVAGNTVWVKSGSYSITSATQNVAGGCVLTTAGATATAAQWLGYTTTRGDGGRPTLTASGISTFKIFAIPNSGSAYIANFIIDGASLTSSRGIDGSAGSSVNSLAQNCKIVNCTNAALIGAATMLTDNCEFTTCTTSTAVQNTNLHASSVHDNTSVAGFSASVTVTVTNSIFANNSGASSDGAITTGTTVSTWINDIFYGNGRDGLKITASAAPVLVQNCYSEANATNQYSATAAMGGIRLMYDGGKGSSLYNSSIASSQVIGFVTCTTTAFVNAAGNDFSLNTVSTGGALLRGAGIPGAFPGLSTTSYPDIGAVQNRLVIGGGIKHGGRP